MRSIKALLVIFLFAACGSAFGQASTYDDLVFEDDSITTTYKASGKNFVYIKSKKGTGGMPKSSKVDSISTFTITDIVLVFSESNAGAISERASSNQERWENLLQTHPQIFQFSTTFKNLCQCNNSGDAEAFKNVQGFYIYYTKPEPPKPEVTKVEEKKVEEKKASEPVTKTKEKEKDNSKSKGKEKEKEKEVVVKKEEKESEKETDEKDPSMDGPATTVTMSESDFKKKKEGYNKPKRAKDVKACRPPCYEGGDEDLNNFFKDNITLTKKQRRHSKQLISNVTLMLNFDGSIKKAMVTGTNEVLNQMVTSAIKNMNLWNPAVKAGVTIKSQVKMILKYDRETKGMKPFEMVITPRPNPKCTKCLSDSEIFGE